VAQKEPVPRHDPGRAPPSGVVCWPARLMARREPGARAEPRWRPEPNAAELRVRSPAVEALGPPGRCRVSAP